MMIIEPQPLSITARGGNKIDKMTLKILIKTIDLIDKSW
jgi:hypothetical protein